MSKWTTREPTAQHHKPQHRLPEFGARITHEDIRRIDILPIEEKAKEINLLLTRAELMGCSSDALDDLRAQLQRIYYHPSGHECWPQPPGSIGDSLKTILGLFNSGRVQPPPGGRR